VNHPSILALIFVPLVATIYGVWLLATGDASILDVAMCLTLGALTQFGVTFGYHRLIVHRSFVAHPAVKAVALALGSMAFQGPVVNWASVHTSHHAHSDHEGDPHSPTLRGFVYAHLEWLLDMRDDRLAEIKAKWSNRYLKDPQVRFFSSTFLFWVAFSLLLPAAIGYWVGGWPAAWTGFIFGGLVRVFITSHVTWSVNSVCHVIGRKMFKTKDQSRNNLLVGLLALGEGWHNNHHAFPASAFHGMRWWQFDATGMVIRVLEKLGLVKNVVRIPILLQEKHLIEA
jgi:stearoyl-CoA desaturase (delta-9 desaturase)